MKLNSSLTKSQLGNSMNKSLKNPVPASASPAATQKQSTIMTSSFLNSSSKIPETTIGQKKIIMKTISEKQAVTSQLKKIQETQEITLQKVVNSLQDKALEEFLERHIFSLQKILEQYKEGFFIRDCENISFIVDYCLEKIYNDKYPAEFSNILGTIVETCFQPFKANKSTLEINEKPDQFLMLFRALAKIMSTTQIAKLLPLRILVVQCLHSIFKNNSPNPQSSSIQTQNVLDLSELIKESSIFTTVVQDLSILVKGIISIENDNERIETEKRLTSTTIGGNTSLELFYAYIKLLNDISYISFNCFEFSQNSTNPINPIEILISIVECPLFLANYEVLSMVLEIFWNCCDKNYALRDEIAGNSRGAQSLKYLFDYLSWSTNYVKERNKELVNDLLALMVLLAEKDTCQIFFVETKFLDILISDGFSMELEYFADKKKKSILKKLTDGLEFEKKELTWNVLLFLTFNDQCLAKILEKEIVNILLNYLTNKEFQTLLGFEKQNIKKFQELALRFMFLVCVRAPMIFQQVNGGKVVLSFIEQQINSNYGGNGAHSLLDTELLLRSTAVLLNYSTTNEGTMELSFDISFRILLEMSVDPLVPIEARKDSLQIISRICEKNPQNKKLFFESGGIGYLLTLSKFDASKPETRSNFLFHVVDCYWNGVVGFEQAEEEFVCKDGIFAIMKLFEKSKPFLQHLILSFLVDLLTGCPRARKVLADWRSKSHDNCVKLFLEIWQQEQKRIRENLSSEDIMPSFFYLNLPSVPVASSAEGMVGNKKEKDNDNEKKLKQIFEQTMEQTSCPPVPAVNYANFKSYKTLSSARSKETARSMGNMKSSFEEQNLETNEDKSQNEDEITTEKSVEQEIEEINESENEVVSEDGDTTTSNPESSSVSAMNHHISGIKNGPDLPTEYDFHKKLFFLLTMGEISSIPANLDKEEEKLFSEIQIYDSILKDTEWNKISQNLEGLGVRPTTPDKEKLAKQERLCKKREKFLKETGKEIDQFHSTQHEENFKKFFSSLKERKAVNSQNINSLKQTQTRSVLDLKRQKQMMIQEAKQNNSNSEAISN